MTREEMQSEALIIQSLLNTAMAMLDDYDADELATMVEMAHGRAQQLNNALDIVNEPVQLKAQN